MAQTKKDHERAASIVLAHWRTYENALRSGHGKEHEEETEKLRVIHNTAMEVFVAFFRAGSGAAFDVQRFRSACKGVY